MMLTIDLGNSRLKWMLDEQQQAPIAWQDPRLLERLFYQWQQLKITQVLWVSTASDTINKQLSQFFHQQNITQQRFTSLTPFKHIKTAYKNQSQLGDDRWLAIVAAYKNHPQPYCIISAGTAITVDFVFKNQHYPSIIIPSEHLMRQALKQNTSQVNTAIEILMSTPNNTQQCVQLGIQTAISSAIEQIFKYYQLLFNQPITTTLTGGDASWLQQQLSFKTSVNNTLLIEGLKRVYQ